MWSFQALMHIDTEMDGTPSVMSDWTSTADVMRRHPLMSTCAPALQSTAIMGKGAPFKSTPSEKWSSVVKGRDTQNVGACSPEGPCVPCSVARPRT